MSNSNLHIINKVQAELTVADPGYHGEGSERLKEAVQKAIEQLGSKMDRMAGDSIILIDLLLVVIGIKKADFTQLEEILSKTLSEKLVALLQDRNKGRKNAGLSSNIIELSKEQNQKDIISHFLLTGRLSWKAATYDMRDSERWLKQLSAKQWLEFIKPLMDKNPGAADRLVSQYPDSLADNIIRQTSIAQFGIDDISPLIHDLLLFTKSKKFNANEYRQIKSDLYKKSLGGMLTGAGREKIFRSLLYSVIRAMGRKKSSQSIYSDLKQWLKKAGTAKDNWPYGFEKETWNAISSDSSLKSIVEQTSSQKTDNIEFTEEVGSITIINAGVVILYPFLSALFKNLGYIEDGEFINLQARERAVCIVHYLATGSTEFPEHELLLAKFLCGWPLADTIDRYLNLSDYEIQECKSMLAIVIQHWEALKNTSPEGLQKNFLQRLGVLKKGSFGWTLYIEKTTHDILLDKLPWGISIIKLKWMDEMLTVNWN